MDRKLVVFILTCLLIICGMIGYSIGVQETKTISEIKDKPVGTIYTKIINIWTNQNSSFARIYNGLDMTTSVSPFDVTINTSFSLVEDYINVTEFPQWTVLYSEIEENIMWNVSSSLTVSNYSVDVTTAQTGHMYETGIKLKFDGDRVENQVFIDIPIGIAVWSSNNYIANCTFINCDDEGIVLFGGSNNTIENCVFYRCCDGIELQKSSNNSFINCVFLNNSHAGIDAIYHSNNDNCFFNCMFYGNGMGVVYFRQPENISFIDCCFLENKQNYVTS